MPAGSTMAGTSETSAGVATALNVPSSAASGRIVAAEPAKAKLQVERQERKPVAERGHADRCGQDGEVTPAVRHLHDAADSTIVTMATTIGVLHPGEMGAAVAAALRSRGH